jgi:predicted HTH transcriptional regulator
MENETAFIEELRTNPPPEGQHVEYTTVLPPPFTLARLIAAFANAEGGRLVLGVADDRTIVGLNPDAPVRLILDDALVLLQPRPVVTSSLLVINERRIYVIDVKPSPEQVALGGEKVFLRVGDRTRQIAPELAPILPVTPSGNPRLDALLERLARERANGY